MDSLIKVLILGLIQGITEWFPVSSSGHLVILKNLFKINEPVVFYVVLHFASLLVLLLFYRIEIIDLIRGLINKDKYSRNFIFMLFISSLPIALIGFFFNNLIKSIFNNLKTVGISLIFTSVILFSSKYPKKKNKKLNYKNSFVIGIAQAIALFPGVSRSGVTISSGLMQGIKKKDVTKFSLLLAIPAIIGANILEFRYITEIQNFQLLIISFIITLISGYISLNLLIKIIENKKFSYFSYYCFFLGIIILFFLI
jgi:undecaprenyl-diphosphatase